jgi:hypothetical protein
MHGATHLPLWAIALVLAVVAPFGARALAGFFERRARERTCRLLGNVVQLGSSRAAARRTKGTASDP